MKRTIKSYVLRAGRMTTRQQQGWDTHYPQYALTKEQGPWNYAEIFGRTAPTVIEIGFGMGQSLCAMARENPQINYIGIEVHQAGIGALSADIAEQDLKNIRLISGDAVGLLHECVPDGSLQGIQIFFPDPWPKKKHHKRRLIQPSFVQLLVQKLSNEGWLHCATDWQDYAEHILSVLNAEPSLHNTSVEETYVERPETRPLTKFEQRGQRLGHGVWDLVYIKTL